MYRRHKKLPGYQAPDQVESSADESQPGDQQPADPADPVDLSKQGEEWHHGQS